MIAVHAFSGRRLGVFGLGASGLSAIRALVAGGARVVAWDDREAARDAARDLGADVRIIDDWRWADLAGLVLAPGVPLTHPAPHVVVQRAHAAGVLVLGDIELFALAHAAMDDPAPVIAITGTNGKSTTTALMGHIVQSCRRSTQVGGNIGKPALDLEPVGAGGVYVLEVSSFQLDLTHTFAPEVAVLLNITPDHMDRHGDMAGYGAAKARVFANQAADDTAVIGVDTPESAQIALALRNKTAGARVIPVSAERALSDGVHAVGGVIYDATEGRGDEVFDLRAAPALLGRHNAQNAAAAYAAARAIGLDRSGVVQALASFAGLAHRMEAVARLATPEGDIVFVNDSKATNPDAARQALSAYDRVYWIAGGRAKGGDFSGLAPALGPVAKGYLIGEAAEALAADLRGAAVFEIVRTLDRAVAAALRQAQADLAAFPGEDCVVLLSPACASFDQFDGFEARGEAFGVLARAAVEAASRAGAAP